MLQQSISEQHYYITVLFFTISTTGKQLMVPSNFLLLLVQRNHTAGKIPARADERAPIIIPRARYDEHRQGDGECMPMPDAEPENRFSKTVGHHSAARGTRRDPTVSLLDYWQPRSEVAEAHQPKGNDTSHEHTSPPSSARTSRPSQPTHLLLHVRYPRPAGKETRMMRGAGGNKERGNKSRRAERKTAEILTSCHLLRAG